MLQRLYLLLLILIQSGNIFVQASQHFDSLYRQGISQCDFDLEIARKCAFEMATEPDLSFVDKAHLNYLSYKISLRELLLSTNNNSDELSVEAKPEINNQPLWKQGIMMINQGKTEKGLSILLDILFHDELNLHDSILAQIDITLGHAYRLNYETANAVAHFHKVISNHSSTPIMKAMASENLALIYDQSGKLSYEQRFDSVRKYALQTIQIAETNNLRGALALGQNQLASLYRLNSNNLDSSSFYAQLAFKNFIDEGMIRHAMNTSIILSDILIKQQQIMKSLLPLEQIHDLLPFSGNEDLFLRVYLQMAKVNELLGNYFEAYEFLSVARLLQEKTFKAEVHRQINELTAQYDLAVKDARIAESEYILEIRKKEVRNLILSLVLILFILFSSFFYWQNRKKTIEQRHKLELIEKQQLEAEVKRKNQELAFKNNELIQSMTFNIQKNNVLKKLKDDIRMEKKASELIQVINANVDSQRTWKSILLDFQKLYPAFIANISQKHPNLSSNEVRLAVLLFLNHTSVEIAGILSVSEAAVNKSRQRLRKKIALSKNISLNDYFQSLR
ncbi:MAG: hypothetical protein JXQ80_00770 [Bacteroidales bacterium]|nr:hypothetical protein [Bacteroidales bacterium]